MRLTLVFLIFFLGTVLSKYHKKTRFDRSISIESLNVHRPSKDQWSFIDHETHFAAYKDKSDNVCYLERLKGNRLEPHDESNNLLQPKWQQKVLYASLDSLTKVEAWRLAGGRIVDFCNGHKIILLQKIRPAPSQSIDPFFNEIPEDENDIVTRRIADVVLTPLLSRAKRQIQLEQRQKLNEKYFQIRSRRQVPPIRGRFKGQTQSQYLNIGNEQAEGEAEAEATQQSSRAVVTGSRGMGQAQSMSSGGTGCEDCPEYGAPDKLQTPYREGERYAGGISYPGGMPVGDKVPGSIGTYPIPGALKRGDERTDIGRYPGGSVAGPVSGGDGRGTYFGPVTSGTIQGSDRRGTYPGTVTSGTTQDGDRRGTYPGTGIPGVVTGGDGIYHGSVGMYPGGGVPGTVTGSAGMYPVGGVPGGVTGGIGTYPGGGIPGTVTGNTGIYPGSVVPGTATGGGSIIGGIETYPGSGVPGGVTGGDRRATGLGMYSGGGVPGTVTGGDGRLPGHVGTYPVGGIPGTIITGDTRTSYPGVVVPGTTAGGDRRVTGIGMYPVSGVPGAVREGNGRGTGGVGTYSETRVPGTITGDARETGGVGTYPGAGVPGTVIGDGRVTGGVGTYPGGGVPDMVTRGVGTYPRGGVTGAITGDIGTYPGSIATYPGGIVPGTVMGNGRVTGDVGTYSGSGASSNVPGAIGDNGKTTGVSTYPGSGVTNIATSGATIYPGTGVSGIPSGQYPSNIMYPSGTYPGSISSRTASLPGTISSGMTPEYATRTVPLEGGTYPPGLVPGSVINNGINYPRQIISRPVTTETVTYPGGIVPSPVLTGSITPSQPGIPGRIVGDTGTQVSPYPTGIQPQGGQVIYPSGDIQGGRVVQDETQFGKEEQKVMQPGTTIPTGSSQTTYPESGTYPISGQQYPTGDIAKQYPGADIGIPGQISYQPGKYPGHYPGITTNQQNLGIPQGRFYSPGAITQVPAGISGQGGIGQYPTHYPGAAIGVGEPSQYYRQPGVEGEDGEGGSQASSSIKQEESGTQASASAQGKYGQGTSQSQVSGVYSGSGSFSAQAGSSDSNKSVQTQISGSKEGAISNAEGIGGYGKSQAQVQLNSDSGATSTGAQSSGWNHGTNSQVQASSKGGMADAQANGEGRTSSQAQIGFQPYMKNDENVERRSKPFHGGGTASAQSGTYRGQSQSQLQGSFQYGITYTGAAQAGSGSGAVASRKPFQFNMTSTELFKPFKINDFPGISYNNGTQKTVPNIEYDYQNERQQGLQTSSSSRQTVVEKDTDISIKNVSKNQTNKVIYSTTENPQHNDTTYDIKAVYGDYEEEYEDEDYDSSLTQQSTSLDSKISPLEEKEQIDDKKQHQSQAIHVATGNEYDVHITQDSTVPHIGDVLQPGDSLPGYRIPPGFRGRVTSVSGEKIVAKGEGKSQSQTVSLVPSTMNVTHDNKSPISETRSLQTPHERHFGSYPKNKHQNNPTRVQTSPNEYFRPTIKQSYYTVTNSVAGKMDDKNVPRKYEHRYYTKSSTCGYFTFSCNVVYGSNGRTKICKPKMPTYPDGTPMKC